MKYIMLYSLMVVLLSCKSKEQKPLWINSKAVLDFHFETLKFSCGEGNWTALLLTSVQPILLKSSYEKGILTINSPIKGGAIAGFAQICLIRNNQSFYYPVQLINKRQDISTIEFRSPKTVNPDSSLVQQIILYQIDDYRNISAAKNNQLFNENDALLLPKTGTYDAEVKNPLTSYYVQAGSCVKIPLKYALNRKNKVFEVTAGPLVDKYENVIADGTLVTFIFQNEFIGKMEVSALKGFAVAKLPALSDYKIFAKIDRINSSQIFLKP